MNESAITLSQYGLRGELFKLVEAYPPEKDSLIADYVNVVRSNGCRCTEYEALFYIDAALNAAKSSGNDWPAEEARKLLKPLKSENERIQAGSKVLAELVSGGILMEQYSSLERIPETEEKTPDFRLNEDFYCEVYCPQESQAEAKKVADTLQRQSGSVQLAISRPWTGSDGDSLKYQTNKYIDRVLNHKWKNDQTIASSINLLWLDLTVGFKAKAEEALPVTTVNHCEHTYVGSIGLWHAFYGEEKVSTFGADRSILKYHDEIGSEYKQYGKNGIFRTRRALSGALILNTDGLVFFENPWSDREIPLDAKRRLSKLTRFRPEYSMFEGAAKLPESVVERINANVDWLYEKQS